MLVISLLAFNCFAQNIIKGNIKSEAAMPIDNANVILFEKKHNSIIAYSVSDEKGDFMLSFFDNIDSLRLEISCMGFKKQSKSISNKLYYNFSLVLQQAVENLNEVIIKQEAIQLKGDTINYNTKLFSDKSDRVIIDVVKKLPGISVTASGQILFNGKAINKFYIEGKDLLEDRYNIASNNLPADAVDQIQILQNHQPVALLNGIQQSDRAAINIKLNKTAKFRLLGNGHLGIGFLPFLSDNSLTLLKFDKTIQFINSLKHNNIGVNLDEELNEQNVPPNLYESGSVKQDLVSLVKAGLPPLAQSRYWFNNNSLTTGNYLIGLSKLFDLKLSVAYEHDQLKDNANSITKVYLPNDTIEINENHFGLITYSKLLSGLTLQANSKQIFLKNALKFRRDWSIANDFISSSSINQKLYNPFINLINELGGILNLNNNLIAINSLTTYTNLPQKLVVMPGQYESIMNLGQPYDGIIQNIQLKGFFTDNSASFTKKNGAFSFIDKFGFLTRWQTLTNDLEVDNNGKINSLDDRFKNIIQRNKISLYNDATFNFALTSLSFSLGLKTSINSLTNKSIDTNQHENRNFLNPNLNILYKFSSFWEMNISLSTSNDFSYDSNHSFILQDYRNLIDSDIPLHETNRKNISYTVGYKNIINAVYSNLTLRYAKNISNILSNNTFDGILNTRKALVQDNPSTNLDLSWNINKYYLKIKTSMSLFLGYNAMDMKQLQQGILTDFRGKTYTIGSKINSSISESFNIQHTLDLAVNKNLSKSVNGVLRYAPIDFLKQSLVFKYFLPKGFQTNLSLEHYYNSSNAASSLNYYFADFGFQKSLIKPKLDFSISASNIFNTKSYSSYSYSNNILVNSDYILRSRMIMFKIGFQF